MGTTARPATASHAYIITAFIILLHQSEGCSPLYVINDKSYNEKKLVSPRWGGTTARPGTACPA